jgi:Carbohydrate esterase 2 N-terminal/GDSL-like Lipase/Acylhydrolase family
MKHFLLCLLTALTTVPGFGQAQRSEEQFFDADNPMIEYMGRVDLSNPKLPRFWNPGVNLRFRFGGEQCRVVLHDEVPDDKVHNYVLIFVGGNLGVYRVKLTGQTDSFIIVGNGRVMMDGQLLKSQVQTSSLSARPDPHGEHLVTICKATEGIGWMAFEGVYADALLPAPALPDRKIEFIGNSITCGFGNDNSGIPCGQGQWFDQSNAWMSYGALTARALKAQWHLTAVSGIGLIHSCCNMTITMPGVFDRMDPRGNQGKWDFSGYQPDVVTVCLGQNDGIQDSVAFCSAYLGFVGRLRHVYPSAKIVLLTSPMGDEKLTAVLMRYIDAVVRATGDPQVSDYFFSKQWTHGCAGHPDIRDDQEISAELTKYLRGLMRW